MAVRESLVQQGVKFLTHPSIQNTSMSERLSFLEKKGLTTEEVLEARKRADALKTSATTTPSAVGGTAPQVPSSVAASLKARASETTASAGDRLKGRVVIVTGGCSGIGKAIAIRCAKEGAFVVVLDVREDPIEGGEKTVDLINKERDVSKQAEQEGDTSTKKSAAVFIKCDVSKWPEVTSAVAKVVDLYGRVDVLINNAAVCVDKALLDTEENEWQQTVDINVKGTFFMSKRVIQQFLTQESGTSALSGASGIRGRIINIASQQAFVSAPENFAYGVSKAAVAYMVKQIAGDYARHGIIANAVAPGKIVTGKGGAASHPSTLESAQARTPFPRLGTPLDVANAVIFLSSDEASYIQGTVLTVDGGWLAL